MRGRDADAARELDARDTLSTEPIGQQHQPNISTNEISVNMNLMAGGMAPLGLPPENFRVPSKRAKYVRSTRHFIRAWRKFRKLSQEELAARIGSTASAISQLETGKQNYTQPMLEALAGALETDPASLLMRDPAEGESIWLAWQALPQEERARALAILRLLAGTDAAE